MNESRKTLWLVIAAVAAVLALWSGWKFLGGSAPPESERKNTTRGPISSMSSMLGPDASGKPRTQPPPDIQNRRGQNP
ncbi:MAG TPA: hypothetical protein VFB38_00755 [Chthonomonadaceae bacterium]|nr:hypothetical protein [Chthonomonadaceae bacterium]